jgi:pimeloyl-ACP methyl ester carboxylesterase
MTPHHDRARRSGRWAGDGITGDLVFIHGVQDTAALWQEVIDRLECPGWTPIPVSLHRMGLHEPRPRGAMLEAYRDQVGEAIDAVDAGVDRPAVVIGHGMGAQIAEFLAVARPHRTVGLVLISPIPLGGFARSAAQRAAFEIAARTRDPAAAADGRQALLVSRSPAVLHALVAGTLGTPSDTALEVLHAWTAGRPLGDARSRVSAPTLLITSDDSFATGALLREQVASRFAHCESAYVRGAGHWPHVEQPTAVARILTEFVSRVADPLPTALSTETEQRSCRWGVPSMDGSVSMKPLSEQLSDLSARAKKAEDDAATARKEERAKIQARVDQLQADMAARATQVDAAAAAAKDAGVGQWHTLQQQVKAHHERIRADLDAKKAEHEQARAERKAERAEDNAAAAIAFAYDAIDYAESAVLDAVTARLDVDILV